MMHKYVIKNYVFYRDSQGEEIFNFNICKDIINFELREELVWEDGNTIIEYKDNKYRVIGMSLAFYGYKIEALKSITQPLEKALDWNCWNCGKSTKNNVDYYMVTDSIWEEYGHRYGLLCWDCLEKQMGREIEATDLIICPLNCWDNEKAKKLIQEYVNEDMY